MGKRFVVYGAPLSGRSDWVRGRARPGDVVWEFDRVTVAVIHHCPELRRAELPVHVLDLCETLREALVLWAPKWRDHDFDVYIVLQNRVQAERLCGAIDGELVECVFGYCTVRPRLGNGPRTG